MNLKVYRASIDNGYGWQTILFVDGICVYQSIKPKLTGAYTGDGNPEFVGQTARQIGLKANGFKRVRGERDAEIVSDEYLYVEDCKAKQAEYKA